MNQLDIFTDNRVFFKTKDTQSKTDCPFGLKNKDATNFKLTKIQGEKVVGVGSWVCMECPFFIKAGSYKRNAGYIECKKKETPGVKQ